MKDMTRINYEIQAISVRLVDQHGNMLGVRTFQEAMEQAKSLSMDLVETIPTPFPPVCRIMDYEGYLSERSRAMSRGMSASDIDGLFGELFRLSGPDDSE